jgi:cytochrome c556
MRNRLVILSLAALLAACSQPEPKTTVQQFMEDKVNPAGELLFHSVEQVSDAKGTRFRAPESPDDWKKVADALAVLQNAPETLTAKGIKAAPPGFKAENPGIESEPAWIQQTIDSHRADFDKRAQRLKAAADKAAQAAQAHDGRALYRSLDGIDKACESCHLHYFYPGDKRAWVAAKEDGMSDRPGVFDSPQG